MGEEFVYKRNLYVISISFFCLFTAFSTIQNLETSIVAGTCHDCDEYCWAGNPLCVDVHQSGSLSKNDAVCSWTEGAVKYCSKYGGECKSTCPNTDDGWTVVVNETLTPAFDDCSGSSNVGAIALGTLYLTFTAFCLTGPYVVRLLKPKWSIAVAFVIFSLFCCANLLVAQFPSVKAMQWGVLLPASAFVGIAASFMWTAHGAYISIIASKYAAALDMDADTVVGSFFGVFYAIFQSTQISGNLTASLLLNVADWSNTSLFLFYLCFAGAGTLMTVFLVTDVQEDDEKTDAEVKPLAESVRGMLRLLKDKRLLALIPLIMYSGIQQGFAWGSYTNDWVKASVGLENIGYVMAAFGAADVCGSFAFGKLSDIWGRFPIICLGTMCQAAVVITLLAVDVGDCDKKYAVLLPCAALWGLGDATWNTQTSAVLSDIFPDKKEDAFANLKMWQSLSTATIFFLNMNASLLSQNGTLCLVGTALVVSFTSYTVGHFFIGFRASEEAIPLLNDDVVSGR